MLFNSPEFMFAFLPIAFLLFISIRADAAPLRTVVLLFASFAFYTWWQPVFLPILIVSIGFNYVLGRLIFEEARRTGGGGRWTSWLLAFAIAVNLLALAYFKYANFIAENLALAFGWQLQLGKIDLPIGISFFTFTQIAFLCDAAAGKVDSLDLKRYALFVSYFPHLIAGPILHHKEMIPQFQALENGRRVRAQQLAAGLTMFAMGLFKKTILADGVAPFATAAFDAAAHGHLPTMAESITAALCYTFQIYFDFSGYCDMAIGISALFGVKLPINFNSPYKARNIIDFWRRWHMTLSRFLRDYLYIPLGGNRYGSLRRYANLLITMLLGGLWHGAGWTFIIWGGLHGTYLVLNHLWLAVVPGAAKPGRWRSRVSWLVTFAAVVCAWIFFRAESLESALALIKGLFGANGLLALRSGPHWFESLAPFGFIIDPKSVDVGRALLYVLPCALVAFLLPNSQEVLSRVRLTIEQIRAPRTLIPAWAPSGWWAGAVSVLLIASILYGQGDQEFLYFKF